MLLLFLTSVSFSHDLQKAGLSPAMCLGLATELHPSAVPNSKEML